ncbi:uncharacterized protein FMAN_06215 [Fusarium mangiferae]|uniref:Uncharacterized protein n=1 Tax=Fusarium mangiferae TaxID=192010 RepID=A0A1L7SRP4_FUSMA|nr:uncharacterized protein FMAN_06215 [Fusarium mangiferae]CVK86514.1 uncharacterized protein FMAN_06215 [Fusarium mangiferae]
METAVLAPSRNPCLINTTQRIPGHRYKATGNAFSKVILDLKDISQLQNDAEELPFCSRRNSSSTEKKATVSENVVIVEDLKTARLSESVIAKQKSSRPSITVSSKTFLITLAGYRYIEIVNRVFHPIACATSVQVCTSAAFPKTTSIGTWCPSLQFPWHRTI